MSDVSRSFEARYDSGRCGLCDEPLAAGQEVVYLEDELVHADCAQESGFEVEEGGS